MESIELYVLCASRSKEIVDKFLFAFTPKREILSDEYIYPQFSEQPIRIFKNEMELIEVLVNDENEPYSIYWRNIEPNVVLESMLFFTNDNNMIVGLVVNDLNSASHMLIKLAGCVEGRYGYVTLENPPPEACDDFIKICKSSDQIKLVDGVYIDAI